MVKIFIGNLSHDAQEDDLRSAFEKYGTVSECACLSSFGFVHMESEEEAQSAIDALNGFNIHGLRIRVEMSHGKKGDGPKRGGRGGGFRGGRGGRGGGGRGGGSRGGRDAGGRGGRPSPYERYPPPASSYYDRYDPYSRYPAYPAERDYYRPLPPTDRYRVPPTDRYSNRERLPERYPYERERMPPREAYPSERMYEREPERSSYYARERVAADYYRQDEAAPPRAGINGTTVGNGYDSYRPVRSTTGGAGYEDPSGRGYGSQAELQTEPIFF